MRLLLAALIPNVRTLGFDRVTGGPGMDVNTAAIRCSTIATAPAIDGGNIISQIVRVAHKTDHILGDGIIRYLCRRPPGNK